MYRVLLLLFIIPSISYGNRIMKFNGKIHRNYFKNNDFSIESNSVNKHLKNETAFKINIKKNSIKMISPKQSNEVSEELTLKTNYLYGPDFKKMFSDYKISYKNGLYSALDLSGEKEVSEFLISLSAGKVAKVVMKRAIGTTTYFYRWAYSKKLKKYYAKSIKVKSFEGVYNKVKEIKFFYTQKGRYFYPNYIGEISSIHLVSAKKNKKISKNYVDWTKIKILK